MKKIFVIRFVSGKSLDKLVKERRHISNIQGRESFFDRFFSTSERRLLKEVYLTVYENSKGEQYVRFTNHLPKPGNEFYKNMNDLIGVSTGYNTTIISCEKCYMFR